MILGRPRDDRTWTRNDRGRSPSRLMWTPPSGPFQIAIGSGWFFLVVAAMWLGQWPFAIVLAATTALAAGQIAKTWASAGEGADMALALLVGALAPLAAAVHTAAFGALLCAGTAVSVLAAGAQRGGSSPPLRIAGFTIQSWFPVSLATGSAVLAYGYEVGAAVWLICLMGIYDAGHYLMGADVRQPWIGAFAGAVGIVVASFTLVMIGVPPLDAGAAVRFGAAAAVLAPAGVVLGSVVLASPDSDAGALRRLDSMLLLAPVWAFVVGRHLSSFA